MIIVKNYVQELIDGVYTTVSETFCLNPILEIGKSTIVMPYIDIEGEALDIEPSAIKLIEQNKKENENDNTV